MVCYKTGKLSARDWLRLSMPHGFWGESWLPVVIVEGTGCFGGEW